MSRLPRFLAAFALAAFAGSAFAQYIWLDEKGTKQFSDTPPPASVPKNRILKEPGKSASAPAAPESGDNASSAAAAPQRPQSIAERNADFNKRKMEREEKERKDAEEARYKAAKAKDCERVRNYQRAIEGGVRIAKTDANGERAFMDDAERARELAETKRTLQECN